MDVTSPGEYALLLIGLGILLVVSVTVILPNILPTPRGRLNRKRRELRHRNYELQQAEKLAKKTRRSYEKLKNRAQQVKPNQLRRAQLVAEDSKTMLGHARENVVVAENRLRKTVLDEYAPVYHENLLRKYLREQN